MFDRIDKSYDKDSLQTPPWLFKLAESLLPDGEKFDIDLAASHDHHLVGTYITKEENSLEVYWKLGSNDYGFCNPPYSRGMIDLFVKKAIEEVLFDFTTIMVIPELNGERRTKDILENASRIIHFDKRINFIHPITGKPTTGNNRGTILVEFSPQKYDKVHHLHHIGDKHENRY